MSNYVQLNNLLDNEVATIISAICFMVIIFVMGSYLGRFMRIKKLEDKWDKTLAESEKAINEFLEEMGISKEISLKRGDSKP